MEPKNSNIGMNYLDNALTASNSVTRIFNLFFPIVYTTKTPLNLKKLCTPSFYLFFNIYTITCFNNDTKFLGNTNTFCIGSYSCDVISTFFCFSNPSWLYFILDLDTRFNVCMGYSEIAWFVILLPIIYFLLYLDF